MPFLTVSEVAVILRVTERTVRRWIASGDIVAQKPGRQYLIHRGEIEKLMPAKAS